MGNGVKKVTYKARIREIVLEQLQSGGAATSYADILRQAGGGSYSTVSAVFAEIDNERRAKVGRPDRVSKIRWYELELGKAQTRAAMLQERITELSGLLDAEQSLQGSLHQRLAMIEGFLQSGFESAGQSLLRLEHGQASLRKRLPSSAGSEPREASVINGRLVEDNAKLTEEVEGLRRRLFELGHDA